jgi:hypothetical protein
MKAAAPIVTLATQSRTITDISLSVMTVSLRVQEITETGKLG